MKDLLERHAVDFTILGGLILCWVLVGLFLVAL